MQIKLNTTNSVRKKSCLDFRICFLFVSLCSGFFSLNGATNERIASWTLYGMSPSSTNSPPASTAVASGGFGASGWTISTNQTGISYLNGARTTSSNTLKLGSSDTNTAVYRWNSTINTSNFTNDYVSWSVSIPNLSTKLKSLNLGVFPNATSAGNRYAGTNVMVKYTLDGGTTLYDAFLSTNLLRTNTNVLNIDLSSKTNLQNIQNVTVEFRCYSWGGYGTSADKAESIYFYGVTNPYAEGGVTPTVSLMGDVTRSKPNLTLTATSSTLDENGGEVAATITSDQAFSGGNAINLSASGYTGVNPIQFRDTNGTVITSLTPSSGTSVSFKIRGVADGVLTGPRPVAVNLNSANGAYDVPATPVALTVLNSSNEVWTNAPIAVINKYVRNLNFNSFSTGTSTNADVVELLVVGNGQPKSSANLAGMVLKEFDTDSTLDKGYKYVFSSAWSNVPAGTLIVIAGKASDMPINPVLPDSGEVPKNFLISVSRDNTLLFARTNTGGDVTNGFSITGTDMLSLMMSQNSNFPVSAAGLNGAMHTIGHGPLITATNSQYAGLFSGSRTNGYIQKNTNTLSSSVFLQVINSHGSTTNALNDYRDDAELELVAASASALGKANSSQNQGFLDYLRGNVDGTGIATLSGSTATPIFSKGQTNQTVSIQITGSVRGTPLTSASITLPTGFGAVIPDQVSLSGIASATAKVSISNNGRMIMVSDLSLTPDASVTINISGRTIPVPGADETGNYPFLVQTSGSGGILTPVTGSPSALVAVPISKIRQGTPQNSTNLISANPWLSVAEGSNVAVEGVATCNDLDASGRFLGFLQDETGGIALADAQDWPIFVSGHRYAVYGKVQSDRGLLRIVPEVLNDFGVDSMPQAVNISLSDVQDEVTTNAVSELWEGKLVCVTNLTKASGSWSSSTAGLYTNTNGVVSTNDITLTVRDGNFTTLVLTNGSSIPSTTQIERTLSIPTASHAWADPEPDYPVSVLAIVSQRSAATNGTNNDGYRLLIRTNTDILRPSIGVTTTNYAISNGIPVFSFKGFETTYGQPSDIQRFWVKGTNLMADVSMRPPVGFEISTNGTHWMAWDETVTTNDANGNPILAYKEMLLPRSQTNLLLAGTNNMLPTNVCYLRLSARAPGGGYGTNYITNGRTLKLSTVGFTNYFDIAPSTVSPSSQTISFAPFPSKTVYDVPFLLTNFTASSTLPLVFTSSDSNVASVVGSTLTIKKAGTTVITAVQTGSVSFLPATNSDTLVISSGSSDLTNLTITMGPLTCVYDGLPKALVTTPTNIPCVLTYNGDLSRPINAGTYAVAAFVNQPGSWGNKTATLTISKYPATVNLGSLNQLATTNVEATYPVTVSTVPPGLGYIVTYNNSTNAPSSSGNYEVLVVLTDPNYSGSVSGRLQIVDPSPDTLLGSANNTGITPQAIGYNSAHYMTNGNAKAWWKYSGVSGVRVFVAADDIESSGSRTSNGVNSLALFNDERLKLRSQGTNYGYVSWSTMKSNLVSKDLGANGGNNHLVVGPLLNDLGSLGIQPMINITASSSFSTSSWGEKWKMYKHYYAMGYLLGRDYGVQRYQMYNEPDLGGLPSDYLERAQIASQALQDAGEDLRNREGKNLKVVVAGPVNAGNAVSDFNNFNPAGSGVGDQVFENIFKTYDGSLNASFRLFQQWDYHQYGDQPDDYASSLYSLASLLETSYNFGRLFPISISEFNTHTASSFDTLTSTLDDENEAANFGAICVRLVQGGANEMYAFKFGETENSGSNYGVAKNGLHYVNNDASANYDTGGITLAGEVFRMFNKACGPGRVFKDFASDKSTMAALKVVSTANPSASQCRVFSVNNSGSGVTWSLNALNWGLPAGAPVIVEEASSQESGGVVAYGHVDGTGLFYDETDTNTPTRLYQRSYSAQLYTLAGNTTNNWITVPALEDTRIFTSLDRSQDISTEGKTAQYLSAKNDPSAATNSFNRAVSLIKFKLIRTNSRGQAVPVRPGDISLGFLEVDAFQSVYRDIKTQAYVYGVDSDWRLDDLTHWDDTTQTAVVDKPALCWSNCRFVRNNPEAGSKLANRVVQGLTNDSTEILGQIVVRTNTSVTKRLDITDYLRRTTKTAFPTFDSIQSTTNWTTNFYASVLVGQEPRWDKSPAVRSVDDAGLGDRQGVGVQIYSLESTTGKGPRLKLVLAKDSDDDGISDQAETELYGTDPNNSDQNANGVPDGMDLLIAGINVRTGTSAGSNNLISFGAIPVKNFGDAPFNLMATATGGTVTYASSNTNVATVSSNMVTIKGAGTTVITARCTGNNTYGSADPVNQILRVNKAKASISATGGVLYYNGLPQTATLVTSPSGLSTIVTYNGSPNAPTQVGEYTVQATILDSNYEGSLDYNSTLSTSALLTILKQPNVVTFSLATSVTSGSSLLLQASSISGGIINYEIVSGPGTLRGQVLTPTSSSGEIVIRATSEETDMFSSASSNQTITIMPPVSGISNWLLGQPTNSANVGKYAIGGATNVNATSEVPVFSVDANRLSLSAVVRTNDTNLAVFGEAGSSLTNWNTNVVSRSIATNQSNIPAGCQRQVFSVDRTNSPSRQFLRLKATLTTP